MKVNSQLMLSLQGSEDEMLVTSGSKMMNGAVLNISLQRLLRTHPSMTLLQQQ